MQDITIDVEPAIMAGALKLLFFFIPVIGAIQMSTTGVENNEFLAILGNYPGALAPGADVPAITYPLLVGHECRLTDGYIASTGNRRN